MMTDEEMGGDEAAACRQAAKFFAVAAVVYLVTFLLWRMGR